MNNKFTTYFLYAIGEIILVVVGILIALQLDNWSNERKERKKEEGILLEIRNDLMMMKADVAMHRDFQKEMIIQSNRFLNQLIDNKICNDSTAEKLISLTYDLQFYPKTSGYKSLESEGLDILSNDSLRKEITTLYELMIPRLVAVGIDNEKTYGPYHSSKVLIERHTSFSNSRKMKHELIDGIMVDFRIAQIKNCEAFLNDEEVYQIFLGSFPFRTEVTSHCKNIIHSIEKIVSIIDKDFQQ